MDYYNSLRDENLLGNRIYIFTVVLTIVVAVGIRHVLHRLYKPRSAFHEASNSTPYTDHDYDNDNFTDTTASNVKTRHSRLLRKQFGILEDDLQLYEELTTTNDTEDMHPEAETPPAYEVEKKLDDNNDTKDMNYELLDGTAAAKMILQDSAPIKHDDQAQQQQAQHSFSIASPSPTASATVEVKKKKKKEKSQYERLQEYRRQQMLVAAESRLEQQRLHRPEHNLPPLHHFWIWYDTQTSLYRQYTLVRDDGIEDNTTIVPYHPSSRRSDKISILLLVTNDMDKPITAYWVDHIGKHIPKGVIQSHGGTWKQTTYVDHPWIFKTTKSDQLDGSAERVLLHFIPHQALPSPIDNKTDSATTLITGIHRFHILPPVTGEVIMYNCAVHDPELPFPASNHIHNARKAAEFALQHCIRMRYDKWMLLQKYIRNIIDFPNDFHYQYIRIANPKFSDSVWNTPAKGVLLAYNFIEQSDTGYVCFGGIIDTDKKDDNENQSELPIETLHEFQLLLHMIHVSEQKARIDYGFQ